MKRFFSWIVLYLISSLTGILTSLMLSLGAYVLDLMSELSTFWRIVIYFFGGTSFLSLVFFPVYYGVFAAISASEAVKPSRRGLRYIVFSIYMLITGIIYIITGLTEGTFHLNTIIMCIYYVMILIFGKEASLNNANKFTEKDYD